MNLERLSNRGKCNLALNPNTPPETLARLAEDDDLNVRWYLTMNPNTSPETLERLADDVRLLVRHGISLNPNTPQYVKEYLDAVSFMELYSINVK
jgi:pentose-5-phosphate-3-epimerase